MSQEYNDHNMFDEGIPTELEQLQASIQELHGISQPSRFAALNNMETQTPSTTTTTTAATNMEDEITSIITNMTDDSTLVGTSTTASSTPLSTVTTLLSADNIYLPATHHKFKPETWMPSAMTAFTTTQQRIYGAAVRRQHMNLDEVDVHALYNVAVSQKATIMTRIRHEAVLATTALKVRRAIQRRDLPVKGCLHAKLHEAKYLVDRTLLKRKIKNAETHVDDVWENVKSGMNIWRSAEARHYHWG